MISFLPTHRAYIAFTGLWILIGMITFFYLFKKEAPYGRFSNRKWGPMISNRLGWIVMEATVLGTLFLWLPLRDLSGRPAILVMLWFFALHYVHRSFIYPFMIRTKGKKMPLLIMLSAVLFNLVNGSLLGIWFGHFAYYPPDWLTSVPFLFGTLLFFLGMGINWSADYHLIGLRKGGTSGYQIPRGKLFQYISSPNLFGEIVEWTGFAILTWSLPGLTFLIWTCANLIPRAWSVHRWYRSTFSDYPLERKALFPFIW